MKQLILCLAGVAILFTSCSEENINKEVAIHNSHIIELVAIGAAIEHSDLNKGLGVDYYCFINLKTDSVFIQQKEYLNGDNVVQAWSGTIKGIAEEPRVLAFIEATKQYDNGETVSPKIEVYDFYSYGVYFSKFTNADGEKYYVYTSRQLDKRFEQATEYLLTLQNHGQLNLFERVVDEDSIIVHVMNLPGLRLKAPPPPHDLPPPPPPIRAKVNYTPPIEKR